MKLIKSTEIFLMPNQTLELRSRFSAAVGFSAGGPLATEVAADAGGPSEVGFHCAACGCVELADYGCVTTNG